MHRNARRKLTFIPDDQKAAVIFGELCGTQWKSIAEDLRAATNAAWKAIAHLAVMFRLLDNLRDLKTRRASAAIFPLFPSRPMGGCNEVWMSVSHGDVLEFYNVDRRARVSDMVIWRARQNRQAQLRRKGQGPPLWKIGIVIELPRSGATLAWTHAKNVYDLWDSAGYLRAKKRARAMKRDSTLRGEFLQ